VKRLLNTPDARWSSPDYRRPTIEVAAPPTSSQQRRLEEVEGRLSGLRERAQVLAADLRALSDRVVGCQPEQASERPKASSPGSQVEALHNVVSDLNAIGDHIQESLDRLSTL
jgi:type II secretory pathway component PulJ